MATRKAEANVASLAPGRKIRAHQHAIPMPPLIVCNKSARSAISPEAICKLPTTLRTIHDRW